MTDARKDPDRGGSPPRELSPWALAGLGMQFVVALLFFVYAGNWIDTRFHTAPIGLLIGVFVGGGGSFVLGVRRSMRQS
jgi:F0F1-type ATP synthase assembly protein I